MTDDELEVRLRELTEKWASTPTAMGQRIDVVDEAFDLIRRVRSGGTRVHWLGRFHVMCVGALPDTAAHSGDSPEPTDD